MKKELGVLLLIFITTVGLSNAVSAAPAMQASTTHSQGHVSCYWIPLKTIQVHIPPSMLWWGLWIRQHYPPLIYRFTSNKQYVVTIWKRVCSSSPPIPTPYSRS